MVIHIPDNEKYYQQFLIKDLPKNWRGISAYAKLQSMASNWYTDKNALVLKVPSAVIPQEYNFIINTSHPHFSSKIKLVSVEDYFWDGRLL